jgi:hypothetical protein
MSCLDCVPFAARLYEIAAGKNKNPLSLHTSALNGFPSL